MVICDIDDECYFGGGGSFDTSSLTVVSPPALSSEGPTNKFDASMDDVHQQP